MATSKSFKKSKGRSSSDPRRPFDRDILHRAQALAAKYQVVVWHDDDEDCYYGRGVELPLAMGDGQTAEDCVKATHEAFVSVLATLLESGQAVPAPATAGKRDQQVNVRLSSDERLILESAARKQGFTGISDFVRAVALAGAK
jgi:predicted RNase H-like HicB family nuclease